jgi:tetratricopeptide (TPR) repeat protein
MPLFGQPPPSPALAAALHLLRSGMDAEAETVVVKAAKEAKKAHGSGSHPLALAYADMARLHHAAGEVKRAATEFQHAIKYPPPADADGRRDRLAFLFGYAGCLADLGRHSDAEKVLRSCVITARDVYGPGSAGAAAAVVPLAEHFLRADLPADAARLLDPAVPALVARRDPAAPLAAALRAEAHRLLNRPDDPFADLARAPDDLVAETVREALGRAAADPHMRRRPVLDDAAKLAARRLSDHPVAADALSAIVMHEAALGAVDSHARTAATRRAVWAFAARKPEAVLLDDVEVGYDPDGTIHLAPKLAKVPTDAELSAVGAVLVAAVDDLFSRLPAGPAA